MTEDQVRKHVSGKIKARIEKIGKTYRELETPAVTFQTIQNAASGRNTPSLVKLYAIADALGCSAKGLLP